MSTIDESIQKMLQDCPILLNEDFKKKYPGIIKVAGFLDSAARVHYREFGAYRPFDRLGVNDIKDYIELIAKEDSMA